MRISKLYIIILIFALCPIEKTHAQFWEYGGWLGITNYFGDLNTSASFEFVGLGSGFFIRYNMGTRFAWKTGINYGKIAFDDATSKLPYQQARNLSFESNLYEYTNHIEFNFFKYDREKEQFSFTPYLLAGISVFFFNPKAEFEGVTYALHSIETENGKYSRFNAAIPLGFGFKYSFTPFWAIGVEGGYRKTFTDYIDDVSTVYPGPSDDPLANSLSDRSGEVIDPPIGVEGKQRGFSETSDDYLFLGITISYTPIKVRCPKPSFIL